MHSPQQFTVEEAAEQIFNEKGLHIADAQVRIEFISDITAQINDRINAMIIALLSEEQAIALEHLNSSHAEASAIRAFLDKHVSDLPSLISNAILAVRNEYLAG